MLFLLKDSFKHHREGKEGGKTDMLHCPKLNLKEIDIVYHLVICRKVSTLLSHIQVVY